MSAYQGGNRMEKRDREVRRRVMGMRPTWNELFWKPRLFFYSPTDERCLFYSTWLVVVSVCWTELSILKTMLRST